MTHVQKKMNGDKQLNEETHMNVDNIEQNNESV